MDPAFLGSWKLDPSKTEGGAQFGKLMNFSEEQIAKYAQLSYVVTMSQSGDSYTATVDFSGAMPNQTYTMKIGEPVDFVSSTGIKAKLTVAVDGNKAVETYVNEEMNAQWTVTRTVSGGVMTAVTQMGPATMTQTLNKV